MTEQRTPTALVVDDYDDSRQLLRTMLEMRRLRVVEAAGGREAVEVALRECPDIVFMDLYMPGLGGLEAARKMRELKDECGEAVLIAFTGNDSTELRSEAIEAGFDNFIVKPVSFDDLDDILRLYRLAR